VQFSGDGWRAPIPWKSAVDEELRHGFTVSEVSKLSVAAVKKSWGYRDWDYDERLSVAWFAAVEFLYTSEEPPDAPTLVIVDRRAIHAHLAKEMHHYGKRRNGTGARFEVYWDTVTADADGPEERVAEHMTLAQVFGQLSDQHQQVLLALANLQSQPAAAASLGMTRQTYSYHLNNARRLFRQAWHEGEQPSRQWRIDRRGSPDTAKRPSITNRAIVQHDRRKAEAATRPAPRPRPRKELAATVPQMVARLEAGESIRSIARSLGVNPSTISQRLTEAGVPTELRWRPRPSRAKDLGVSDEEPLRRRNSGESLRSLATAFGTSNHTILHRLRRAGYAPQAPITTGRKKASRTALQP
jgi:hypothetical protein